MEKIFFLCLIFITSISYAQNAAGNKMAMIPAMTESWQPVRNVEVSGKMLIPSDAIILFNGKDLDKWHDKNGQAPKWLINKGELVVVPGTGSIYTKEEFEDCQLHVEWNVPQEVNDNPMKLGNSGIFLQDRYEIQVLNSYRNLTYSNGLAGSIYKQSAPLVNVSRPVGQWNIFDIIYTAPRFRADSSLFTAAQVTILHNGVVIQNNTRINGQTVYIGIPEYKPHGAASLQLQDHDSPVRYRNIWIRKL